MAKQDKRPKTIAQAPPKKASGGFSAGGYILRNLAILAVIGIVALFIKSHNSKFDQVQGLTQDFYRIRQQNPNSPELQTLYNQIMEIQNDTSFLTRVTRGYHWAINDLALGNLENIHELDSTFHANGVDSTEQSVLEQKMAMKVGLYPLLKYINQNTPKDAVILLPEGDAELSDNGKWNFIYDPEWVEYFIYPRLCLTIGREDEHPDLAKRVTHVLIVEGKGYDKLHYDVPVEQRVKEGIFPINEPSAALKPQQ